MARMSEIRKKAMGTAPNREADGHGLPEERAGLVAGDADDASTEHAPEIEADGTRELPGPPATVDAVTVTEPEGSEPSPAPAREDAPVHASGTVQPESAGLLQQWVVFQCSGVHYALHGDQVHQIEMPGEITPVPNTPAAVSGVFNFRGEIVPVIDLRVRLGLSPALLTLAARIIILRTRKRRVGMLVDSAREVIRLARDQILPPSEYMHGLSGRYLDGIVVQPERTILVLDLEHVLRVEEALEGFPSAAWTQQKEQ